jgi:trimeric autotransporter adhesin
MFVCALVSSAQPMIRADNGVLNATGYRAQLAPDTVFVIFGSGLGPATIQIATAPDYPAMLAGTSVSFTPAGGGTPIQAKMVYTLASQVAGVLPSSISPGTYAVTVTYNGATSMPQSVPVVPRSFGIATSNSAGTGAAQATIGNVNNGVSLVRLTAGSVAFGGYSYTLSPAHPGDELVLWGTGGGADPKNDTGGTSGDQTAAGNFSVNVNGTQIVPLYAGASSGYPGLWQINFVLPTNIAADCFASVQVSAGGQLSNAVTIAIADPGAASCLSSIPDSTLSLLDSGSGTVTWIGLGLAEQVAASGTMGLAGGVIDQFTVPAFLLPYSGPKIDACRVLPVTYTAPNNAPYSPEATLDAGTITLSGGGVNQTLGKLQGPTYYGPGVTVTHGATYTLTATGGSQVGPFTVSATFPDSFTVTNFSSLSAINRSQPLTINWTGSGFDHVGIWIQTQTLSRTNQSVTLYCSVPASLGTYTIPAAALSYLIPSAGSSILRVQTENTSGVPTSAFSNLIPNSAIPLTGGGLVNFGGFTTSIIYQTAPTVQ